MHLHGHHFLSLSDPVFHLIAQPNRVTLKTRSDGEMDGRRLLYPVCIGAKHVLFFWLFFYQLCPPEGWIQTFILRIQVPDNFNKYCNL